MRRALDAASTRTRYRHKATSVRASGRRDRTPDFASPRCALPGDCRAFPSESVCAISCFLRATGRLALHGWHGWAAERLLAGVWSLSRVICGTWRPAGACAVPQREEGRPVRGARAFGDRSSCGHRGEERPGVPVAHCYSPVELLVIHRWTADGITLTMTVLMATLYQLSIRRGRWKIR